MQTKTRWRLGLSAVLLTGALVWAFSPRPVLVELADLRQGRFETVIEEEGKTRVLERYTISAPITGRWQRPRLKEGDAVAAGELLGYFQAATAPVLDARSQAEMFAHEQAAEAALARAKARSVAAQIALQRAQQQQDRSEQLQRQGFVANAVRDDERLQAEVARQDQLAAQAEVQVAQHELTQSRAARQWQGQGGGRLLPITSPAGGQVLRVQQGSESVLPAGAPLLEIGDVRQLEVVAELLSSDALQVRPGQPVLIERWGGDQALQAVVRRVEPGAFTKVSALGVEEQRVRVLMALKGMPDGRPAVLAGLGDGFRVSARIITRVQEPALMLPVSAVFPLPGDGSGRYACFVADQGRARLVPLTLRGRNGLWAWVETDMKPGTRVVVYPPANLLDGARIRGS